jgi:hypothetical protein
MSDWALLSYIIKSEQYNKKHNIDAVSFGTKTFMLKSRKEWSEAGIQHNLKKMIKYFEKSKLEEIKYSYSTYYFEKENKFYKSLLKTRDKKIKEAKQQLNPRAFLKEKNKIETKTSKLIIITTDRQKYLYDILNNYNDAEIICLKHVPCKFADKTDKAVELLNDYKNKNPKTIIYHKTKKTPEEQKERHRIYKQNNKEKIALQQKEYQQSNRLHLNEQKKERLYLQKLKKHFTDDEVILHKNTIIDILNNDDLIKIKVIKLVDIINTNNHIRLIISKEATKPIKLAISKRILYIKNKNKNKN